MNFLKPNQTLAEEIIMAMQTHVESGHMIQVNVADILSNFNNWFVGIGSTEELTGFFCLRHPHPNYTELGSVRSLVPNGLKPIIQKFELERKTPYGCAITLGNPQKFINYTQGNLEAQFPDWYQRDATDKHFVQWS